MRLRDGEHKMKRKILVVGVHDLVSEHGCAALKKACFKFLTSPGNLKAAMAFDGFEHVRISCCPSVLEELVAMLAPSYLFECKLTESLGFYLNYLSCFCVLVCD